MEHLRVPTRQVDVRILLDDGRSMDGGFYTATSSPGGAPETVLERLNDEGREFVPVRTRGKSILLNKSGIVTVQVPGRDEVAVLLAESALEVPVRLNLSGGIDLPGKILLVAPKERSRVIDFLNDADRFFPILGEGNVTLVQTRYVVSVHPEAR